MDKIQRQILKNQLAIMDKISGMKVYDMKNRVSETIILLSPTIEKEPCCDMEETRQ